jgi:type IV pilus assembly protein PilV
MIEVLVTMVIIAFGLLGMAGLQMRLQMSEMESYQRSQALLLLSDMANRIAVNRTAARAGSYAIDPGTPTGAGADCAGMSTATQHQRDMKEWCNALQGAGEVTGGVRVGAMVGGRGCVESRDGDILVTVAWQGLTPIAAPPATLTCGANSYDAPSGGCVSDRCRRTVTTLVRIAALL